jgi:8-amino-7-oxononanoate synthase
VANCFHDRIVSFLGQLPEKRVLRNALPLSGGRVQIDGRLLTDFSSNDYLGLGHHPDVIAAARQWTEKYGAGATASRLITGNHPEYEALEAKVAGMKGSATALLMNSGFQANSTVLAALLDGRLHDGGSGRQAVNVFSDRLVHASIHFGIAAAGARQRRFRHNDLAHLQSLLERHSGGEAANLIVSESVFSMDGDCADIATLRQLAERHDALLYIDEAHATGVHGPAGAGLTAAEAASRYDRRREVVIGTFGKALGSFGAAVACSDEIRDYLVNRCSGLIYATALPPAVLGSIHAALELVPSMDAERKHVLDLAAHFRHQLREHGIDTGFSSTQIVPVIIGDERATMKLAGKLLEQGFLVGAIRPPTVPPGTSRLRIAFSAAHDFGQADALVRAIVWGMP